MKNTTKIALGILVGGTLILVRNLRKKIHNKNKMFTAPDGNMYKENEMYRNSQGEIFKNGKQQHFKTPELTLVKNYLIDSSNRENNLPKNENVISKNTIYHQKGIRHH